MTNSIDALNTNALTLNIKQIYMEIYMDRCDPINFILLSISISILITIVYFYNISNGNKNIQPLGSNSNMNPKQPEDPKKDPKKKSEKSEKIKKHLKTFQMEYILGGILLISLATIGYCYINDISLYDITNFFTGKSEKRPTAPSDLTGDVTAAISSNSTIINDRTNTDISLSDSANDISNVVTDIANTTETTDKWMNMPGYKESNLLEKVNGSDLGNSINPDYNIQEAQYDFDVDDYLSNYEKTLQAEMEGQEYNFFSNSDNSMEEVDNYMLEYEQQLAAEIEDKFQKEYFMNYEKRMAEEMEKQLQQELSEKFKEGYYSNSIQNSSISLNEEDRKALDAQLDEAINYFSNLADEVSKSMEEWKLK